MDELASEFDTAWKQALEWFFEPFLAFFFPLVHGSIDWSREPEFLDKELQKIVPEAEVGRGTVDVLVKVWTLDGKEAWLLIHVEVQSQYDAVFPERMYTYNHRLRDRYGRMPVSLAILGDDSGVWRPDSYRDGRWGCEVRFTYIVAKLLDFRTQEAVLAADNNPFAAITLAHLKAIETRGDPAARFSGKLALVKSLYDRGLTRERVIRLFRLIDWMLKLPPVLGRRFIQELDVFEKEKQMPLLSPTEQMWRDDVRAEGKEEGLQQGLQKGLQQGLHRGIERLLKIRFGASGLALMPRVHQFTDPATTEAFLDAIESAPDLDALSKLLPVGT